MKYLVLYLHYMFLLFLTSLLMCTLGGEIDEDENGAFMFLSSNDEFCEERSAPVSKTKGKPQCHEEVLLSYLYSLQVINPESVIALATKNKLEKICANISKEMHEMQEYLKKCSLQPQQDVYTRLLKGVSTLYKKLCTNDPYHKKFMGFKKCYSQLQSEFNSCNGPADWSETSESKKVCKAYQEIADCYYIKTSVLCGNEAASIFRDLVNAVIGSVVTVSCSNNIPGSLNYEGNKNLSKIANIKTNDSSTFHPLQILLIVTLIILIKCM